MILFACTHKKCPVTYQATSPGAMKRIKGAAVYHYCLRSRRELRLMRKVTA